MSTEIRNFNEILIFKMFSSDQSKNHFPDFKRFFRGNFGIAALYFNSGMLYYLMENRQQKSIRKGYCK